MNKRYMTRDPATAPIRSGARAEPVGPARQSCKAWRPGPADPGWKLAGRTLHFAKNCKVAKFNHFIKRNLPLF